jgi:hypothetical protein
MLLYKATEPLPCRETPDSFPKELEPISIAEKNTVVKQYWEQMDPESNIYGCASCGVWVIMPKKMAAHQRTLSNLQLLRFTDKDNQSFLTLGEKLRHLRGVTLCEDTYRYHLKRIFLTTPCTLETIHAAALLCYSCFKSTMPSKTRPPPMSLKARVDYGLAWLYLPELSFIENCCFKKSDFCPSIQSNNRCYFRPVN